ncbi:hypothetical protein MtrunA17_Chr8g0345641 [Medicago truncatula]|uniref:Uncharacterized protein n=1 Tax=Medicago truncatula TaxID=3880 RepID=A0A396GLH1_MEDTR|nr:hypothetical protein MtrunA17_Chr8g0345641 [Medicago truncatula]
MTRISKVSKKVINRTSAGVNVLEPSSHHSQHSQSPILNFLCSQLLKLLRRTTSPTKWIKPKSTRVSYISSCELVVWKDRVSVDTTWIEDVSPPSTLGPTDENELNYEECGGVCEILLLSSSVP